jgi:KDO2-lipid IV(A) lauroyltransferase
MKRETRHLIEDKLAGAIGALVALLPRRASLGLGRALGWVWGRLDRRHRAIAVDNLRRAFPDWDEARLEATALGVYAHFAAVLLDILWLARAPRARLLEIVDWEGRQRYEAAMAKGKGVLFVTAHLGNWELQAVNHGYLYEPVSAIARWLDNPRLDARLCAFRRRSGNTVLVKRQALVEALRTIRAGHGVAVLIDQNVQEKDGIFVEFFGRPAATTTVAAAVALKTGCVLLPVRSRLLPGGRYVLTYDPPVEVALSGDRTADIVRLTQALTTRIESWVRETPEQWLWIHRRWRTRPPAEPRGDGSSSPAVRHA